MSRFCHFLRGVKYAKVWRRWRKKVAEAIEPDLSAVNVGTKLPEGRGLERKNPTKS